MLTRAETRRFYDRFGSKQDRQGFYEDRATRDLLEHADFAAAKAVLEFGSGTGRFAHDLFANYLPTTTTYYCLDISSTMINLSRQRLAEFGDRVMLALTDGSPHLPVADAGFDRFVSNYVFDLLPEEDIHALLKEAHRVLVPDGYLCAASLTDGLTPFSKVVTSVWKFIHRINAKIVGGCRPIRLLDYIHKGDWRVFHHNAMVAYGISSEIMIARKSRR